MISIILAASIAASAPVGIPDNVQQDCSNRAEIVERVKFIGLYNTPVEEVLEQLSTDGYNIEGSEDIAVSMIIEVYEYLSTPEALGEREFFECLDYYRKWGVIK